MSRFSSNVIWAEDFSVSTTKAVGFTCSFMLGSGRGPNVGVGNGLKESMGLTGSKKEHGEVVDVDRDICRRKMHANVVMSAEGKLLILQPQRGADSPAMRVRLRCATNRKDANAVGVCLVPDESFLITVPRNDCLRVADLRTVRSPQSGSQYQSESCDSLYVPSVPLFPINLTPASASDAVFAKFADFHTPGAWNCLCAGTSFCCALGFSLAGRGTDVNYAAVLRLTGSSLVGMPLLWTV